MEATPMRKFTRMFLTLGVCLVSVTSASYVRTDEELARINSEYKDILRTIDGFSKQLSGEALSKYKVLKKALESYATSHSENEVYAEGTGYSDVVAAEKISVQREFIELFKRLDTKQFKPQSELDLKKEDAELNQTYQILQKNKNLDTGVAADPSRSGIRNTQRKWIQYRDAWLAFSKINFPTVDKDALNASLTSDRIVRLKNIKDN